MTTQQARDGTNGGTLTVLNHDGRTLFWAQVMVAGWHGNTLFG